MMRARKERTEKIIKEISNNNPREFLVNWIEKLAAKEKMIIINIQVMEHKYFPILFRVWIKKTEITERLTSMYPMILKGSKSKQVKNKYIITEIKYVSKNLLLPINMITHSSHMALII